MVTLPVNGPNVVGMKVTSNEACPEAGIFVGSVPGTAKGLTVVMLEIDNVAEPEFVTVTVIGKLVALTTVAGKLIDVGETLIAGPGAVHVTKAWFETVGTPFSVAEAVTASVPTFAPT